MSNTSCTARSVSPRSPPLGTCCGPAVDDIVFVLVAPARASTRLYKLLQTELVRVLAAALHCVSFSRAGGSVSKQREVASREQLCNMRLHLVLEDLPVALVQVDTVEAVAPVHAFVARIENEQVLFFRFLAMAHEVAALLLRGNQDGADATAHTHAS